MGQRFNLPKKVTNLSRANNADVSVHTFNKPNAFLSTSMQRIGSTTIAETQNSDAKGGRVSNAHPNGVVTIGSSSSISMRKGYEGMIMRDTYHLTWLQ